MEKLIEKANVLIEALPYFKDFFGKTFVIKYGGSIMADAELKEKLIEDITLLKYVGINPVVVHGGGQAINKTLDRLNIESNFIDGLRVTDKDTMEIVEMVLSAQINKEIVALMNKMQAKAVGISGKDGSLIRAKKKEFSDPAKDLGFVGEVDQINPELVEKLIEDGYIPVIAPVGVNEKGETLNINADSVAGELAAALKAEKLIYLTDVDGIRYDAADESTRVSQLTFSEIKEWIADGKIKGGMLPKVEGCMQAVESGVIRTHILNGLVAHPLLLEIFTDQGVGTMILKD
ncbi:acetylglutamate kinase [Halanaerobium congolense]|nr:acetylglutamate kinase [Halanaerobium congolense]OEG61740.1 MAG: acetylglutamate kinase [Halanaerobium sp. MDAL1]PTX16636.1 N-acetylglutamate kinase [Halanaerobium congolense]